MKLWHATVIGLELCAFWAVVHLGKYEWQGWMLGFTWLLLVAATEMQA